MNDERQNVAGAFLHSSSFISAIFPPMVHVRDLVKRYGTLQAVRGVSLDVAAGEIFGLLGPNGAGKTTTLECILGLRIPDAGSITIDGIDAIADGERVKQIFGAQLQATALQDKLTPREALKFFGSFYRHRIKPDQLIERFSLEEKADSPFDSLSAGQKQRLALALAFVNGPKLIFLDEPTAGLDAQSRKQLHEDIARLKADGRSVVLSTHYIEEAERLCDRIAIIHGGRIIQTGTPGELITRANLPEKVTVETLDALHPDSCRGLPALIDFHVVNGRTEFTTADGTALVIGLIHLIEAEKGKLIDLRIQRATLEDVFLKMTAG